MANLQVFAMLNQTAADSGIPPTSHAFRDLVLLAVAVIGIGGLAALNWNTLNKYVHDFSDGIRALGTGAFEKVVGWVKMFGSAISELWDKLKSLNPFHHTGFEGSVDGGGGLIKTSFGGGIGSAGALSAGERGQYAAIIRKVALQEGVDPNALLKIYGTEGASAWYGDGGHSIGPFQLYDQGLGALYHGSRARSAAGVEDQARFVARYGKSHGGWSSGIWHGLRDQGIGSIPFKPYRKEDPPAVIHNTMYLDGEVVHRSVVKRMVRGMTHPTTAPYHDGSRHWTPPDAGLVGV